MAGDASARHTKEEPHTMKLFRLLVGEKSKSVSGDVHPLLMSPRPLYQRSWCKRKHQSFHTTTQTTYLIQHH
jgi:hypothetical protein